jgi:hypothetical protein
LKWYPCTNPIVQKRAASRSANPSARHSGQYLALRKWLPARAL